MHGEQRIYFHLIVANFQHQKTASTVHSKDYRDKVVLLSIYILFRSIREVRCGGKGAANGGGGGAYCVVI
jgi:hypothetical protein